MKKYAYIGCVGFWFLSCYAEIGIFIFSQVTPFDHCYLWPLNHLQPVSLAKEKSRSASFRML